MNQRNMFPRLSAVILSAAICLPAVARAQAATTPARIELAQLEKPLQVGDEVSIRIPHASFSQVADATSSWTNHVGIVAEVSAQTLMVAESWVPVSGMTLLKNNPQADQRFWRAWYFGSIPWQRLTATPANLLSDGKLHATDDGMVMWRSDIDEGVTK